MKISLVVSTRENLRYLKWSYDSIRKNQGDHEVWICYGIDHCTDGTQDWIEQIKKVDPLVKSIENTTGKRCGHTIMYDRIINEIVETDLAMIFHSDMYLCPGALDSIEELMYGGLMYNIRDEPWYVQNDPIKKRIVSLTRIEPPLHPPGFEKIVANFGTEPESFDEQGLLTQLYVFNKLDQWKQFDSKGNAFWVPLNGSTEGVFAPFCFWVDEFKAIGGHDPLYRPQSKEDSDLFNRFKLNGTKFIQPRNAFVYHLTCRGSRFNPTITQVGTNSTEWENQNIRSTRNFIRKWGTMVDHDEYLNPIVHHKYNIGLVIKNGSSNLLYNLEPWCDHIQIDLDPIIIDRYIEFEQPNTSYDLRSRINDVTVLPEIIVTLDGHKLDQVDLQVIHLLSDILSESGEVGEFGIGNLQISIKELNTYENDLIICEKH